jgi:hypothetical protein
LEQNKKETANQLVLNLKVLLITGLLAEDIVKRNAQKSGVKTEVLALKVPVAALLTPAYIASALENLNRHCRHRRDSDFQRSKIRC